MDKEKLPRQLDLPGSFWILSCLLAQDVFIDSHFIDGLFEYADGGGELVKFFVVQGPQAVFNAFPQLLVEVFDDSIALGPQRDLHEAAVIGQCGTGDAVLAGEFIEDRGHLLFGHDENLSDIPDCHRAVIVQQHENGKMVDGHSNSSFTEEILPYSEKSAHECS